jgi:hypothetical protein
MRNIGRTGAANAEQHAIANATMASILRDAFFFAMRNPRGDSIATVFIACWRNAASGYSTNRFERSDSNLPIRTVFPDDLAPDARNALLRLPDRHADAEDARMAFDLVVALLLPELKRRDQRGTSAAGAGPSAGGPGGSGDPVIVVNLRYPAPPWVRNRGASG